MYLAEAIPPTGPVALPALAALFALCALIFAIGMIKLVDAVSRALFGTISGAVGWIPYAGRLVSHNLHKIEQKISHMLGTAERKLDGYVALTWHTLAHVVTWMGQEIKGAAETSWHLAQQAKAFVHRGEMHRAIRGSTAPLKARQSTLRRDQHNLASEQRALHKSVAEGVYPRLKVAENATTRTIPRSVANARAEAKAAENAAIASYKYIVRHRRSVIAGAFTGAVAWALTRLGGGWIRCANWRKIGKAVCRLPSPVVDALIAALLAELVLANFRQLVEFAQASQEEVTHEVARMLGLDLPRGRFTIE